MELEDLKQALSALDHRLDLQVAVQARTGRQNAATSLHRSLRPLARGQVFQAGLGFLSILLGVAAWRSDMAEPGGLFFSGVIVHLYGIATMALAILTSVKIARLDEAGPVLAIQRGLAELQRLNVAAGYVLGMSWWVLWVPFVIVIFSVAFGVNLYELGPAFTEQMVCCGVIGFLVSAALHRWAAATGHERLAALFDNALTGSSLRNAQSRLAEIARFDRD